MLQGEGFSQHWGLSTYHLHRTDPHIMLEQRWPGHLLLCPHCPVPKEGLREVTWLAQGHTAWAGHPEESSSPHGPSAYVIIWRTAKLMAPVSVK